MSSHIDLLERIADMAQLTLDNAKLNNAAMVNPGPTLLAIAADQERIYSEDLTLLREYIRSEREIERLLPFYVDVLGEIWDPYAGTCAMTLRVPGTVTPSREVVARWLRENARDFVRISDFRIRRGDRCLSEFVSNPSADDFDAITGRDADD